MKRPKNRQPAQAGEGAHADEEATNAAVPGKKASKRPKRSTDGEGAWWSGRSGWKSVNVGDDLLLGAEEGGFAGLEVLEDYTIIDGNLAAPGVDTTLGQELDTAKQPSTKKSKKPKKAPAAPIAAAAAAAAVVDTGDGAATGKTEDVSSLKARLQALERENAALKAGKQAGTSGKGQADGQGAQAGGSEAGEKHISPGKQKWLEKIAAKKQARQQAKLAKASKQANGTAAEHQQKTTAAAGTADSTATKAKQHKVKDVKQQQADTKERSDAAEDVEAGQASAGTAGVDVSAWRHFALHPSLEVALSQLGFSSPTEIQSAVLPAICRDRVDVIGAAQTGSGKTLAFGLPIMQTLLQEQEAAAAEGVEPPHAGKLRALIMAPTRELALQVCSHLQAVGRTASVKVVAIVGGLAHVKQERLLRGKPPVVVATPGRLWELLRDGSNPHLSDMSGLRFLVLDEADRMVQRGHFQELSSILNLVPRPGVTRGSTYDADFHATLQAVNELEAKEAAAGGKRKRKDVADEEEGDEGVAGEGAGDSDGGSDADDDAEEHGEGEDGSEGGMDEHKSQEQKDDMDTGEGDEEGEGGQEEQQQGQGARQAGKAGKANKVKGPLMQTLVFSATLTLPAVLRKRLRRGGGGAVGGTDLDNLMDKVPFRGTPRIVDLSSSRRLAQGIKEAHIQCLGTGASDRDAMLYYLLLRHPGRALVFVNAVSALRRVAALLKLLGLPAYALHAQQQQRQRLKALDSFKSNPQAVLVATDVAARGLDVKDVRMVVHYQLPASIDTYIHRAGRTARGEGQEGVSVALVAAEEAARWTALCKAMAPAQQQQAGQDQAAQQHAAPPAFPVDATLMPKVVERVKLALKIDEVERSRRKQSAHDSWEQRAAADTGLDMEHASRHDDEDDDALRAQRQEKQKAAQIIAMKAQLAALTAQPLAPRMSHAFFTGGAVAGVALSGAASRGGVDSATPGSAGPAVGAVAQAVALASKMNQGAHHKHTVNGGVKKATRNGKTRVLSMEQRAAQELARRQAVKQARRRGGAAAAAAVAPKKGGMVVIPSAPSRETHGQDAVAALRRKLQAIGA